MRINTNSNSPTRTPENSAVIHKLSGMKYKKIIKPKAIDVTNKNDEKSDAYVCITIFIGI